MAIFHFTIKIIGRSKGKSILSASAYLNGDVMKNEETGKISDYTSKKEVVYSQLMMCENAPPDWKEVPEEKIEQFRKSVRYKRAEEKEEAITKFKLIYRKQKLWNEVLKVEKESNAQLGRAFEFSLPKEWSLQEQIDYTTDFIQKNFVEKGMCADWSIHDKKDGNPHVHMILTMRPFCEDHTWGKKEGKDWAFVRDETGGIVIDTTNPNWWQDKKNPDRCGIRIPVLDEEGKQKLDSRNRKQWKREVVDTTGWNNPKNCELWRSEWAKVCNQHLSKEDQIDHRSYKRQGKQKIPTIHEGADVRKIDKKFQEKRSRVPSWKIEENQVINEQNVKWERIQKVLCKKKENMQQWKERIHDIRREQRGNFYIGGYDSSDRGTTGISNRIISNITTEGTAITSMRGTESGITEIKQRVAGTKDYFAEYRRNVESFGITKWENSVIGNRKSAMERISREVKQREYSFAETERQIMEVSQKIREAKKGEKSYSGLKRKEANAEFSKCVKKNEGKSQIEDSIHQKLVRAEEEKRTITGMKPDVEQRKQNQERISIKEKLEANKRLIAEREKESKHSRYHDQGLSR